MPKVLCLHGLGQNGKDFYQRSILPIANQLPDWTFDCPEGIFLVAPQVDKFVYNDQAVTIKGDTQSIPDAEAETAAILTTRAYLTCLTADERFDAQRKNPRTTRESIQTAKAEAEAFLQRSRLASRTSQELMQSLPGEAKRSWIVQVPEFYSDAGMWTSFDAALQFLHTFYEQHGPYDGIIGFSQGGMIVSLLVKILAGSSQGMEPAFSPSNARMPSFAIFSSVATFDAKNSLPGLRRDLQIMSKAWQESDGPASTHILSLWGRKDKYFPLESFSQMSQINHSIREEVHPFGHSFPVRLQWPQFLANWMSEAIKTDAALSDLLMIRSPASQGNL